MERPEVLFDASHCGQCACGEGLGFSFSFAFQPIVDVVNRSVFAHEALVRGTEGQGAHLGGRIIAEGVETKEEYFWLRSQGITLFQGFLFAKPGFECLPEPEYPA
ncbi:hypothetical protein [Marinobacter sp.]|uniref:hypothetical protein n=1 Tax=Marinobacter sp. TaxID=50741 RepID=UPI0035682E47